MYRRRVGETCLLAVFVDPDDEHATATRKTPMQRAQHFRMTRIVAYDVAPAGLVPRPDSQLRRTRFGPTGEAGTLLWWQMTTRVEAAETNRATAPTATIPTSPG